MEKNTYTKIPKILNEFCCEKCNYNTSVKKDYNKHLLTAKHLKLTNATFSTYTKIPILGNKNITYYLNPNLYEVYIPPPSYSSFLILRLFSLNSTISDFDINNLCQANVHSFLFAYKFYLYSDLW
jgi:hypothetical protein